MNAAIDDGSGTLFLCIVSLGDSSFPSGDPTTDLVAGIGTEFEFEFAAVTLIENKVD